MSSLARCNNWNALKNRSGTSILKLARQRLKRKWQTYREPSGVNLSLVRGELTCCTRRAVCTLRFANRVFLRLKNRFVGLLSPFGYSLTTEGVAMGRLPDSSSAVFVVGRSSCRVPVL